MVQLPSSPSSVERHARSNDYGAKHHKQYKDVAVNLVTFALKQ